MNHESKFFPMKKVAQCMRKWGFLQYDYTNIVWSAIEKAVLDLLPNSNSPESVNLYYWHISKIDTVYITHNVVSLTVKKYTWAYRLQVIVKIFRKCKFGIYI